MKLIMLSKDAKVFEKGSGVRERLSDYGNIFDELHIVVFSKTRKYPRKDKITNNVHVYSPASNNKIFIFIKTLGILFSLGRKFKNEKDSWITAQDPFETGLLAFVVSRYFRIRLQLQIHTDFLNEQFKLESIKNRIKIWLAKLLLPRASSIRVVSERIKKSILENIKEKLAPIYVTSVFIDAEKISSQKILYNLKNKYPQFKKIILMASRLEKEKNFPLALRSFKKFLDLAPDSGLVICGDGSEKDWIKKYITFVGVEKNVRFEEWQQDIISAYRTADVFLVTSLYEGYGMSIVEALLCGCPVVSTDVGVAREAGAVIVSNDPGEISRVIYDQIARNMKGNLQIKILNKPDYLESFRRTFN